jgi:hypothetical protein
MREIASPTPRQSATSTVLYLHMGMPKTGTSLLQSMLSASGPALARQGYAYPDLWPGSGHYGLSPVFQAPDGAPDTVREVRDYLADNQGRKVVLSLEGLSFALHTPRKRSNLAQFLNQCSGVAEVRAIIALRRIDEFYASLFLHVTKVRPQNAEAAPEAFVSRRSGWMDTLFSGMRWLREEQEIPLALVPYFEDANVLPGLFEALGIDPAELRSTPKRKVNRRLGLKAHSALALPEAQLERVGVERSELVPLLQTGTFVFEDETYDYDPLGYELRSQIHERALREARENGITEYVEAFGSAELPRASRTHIDASLISEADLADLIDAVAAWRARGAA